MASHRPANDHMVTMSHQSSLSSNATGMSPIKKAKSAIQIAQPSLQSPTEATAASAHNAIDRLAFEITTATPATTKAARLAR